MIFVRWPTPDENWLELAEARRVFMFPPHCCRHHRTWFPMTAQWEREAEPLMPPPATWTSREPAGSAP